MSDAQRIIQRVKALRNLASSSNVNEAATAAAQAEAMIAKYRLEEADLEIQDPRVTEAIGEDVTPLEESGKVATWRNVLAAVLCKQYGVFPYTKRVIKDGKRTTVFVLIGRPSDVQLVRYMYAWITVKIQWLSQGERGHSARNAFRLGAVSAIKESLKREQAAQAEAYSAEHGHGAALALSNRAAEARKWAMTAHSGTTFSSGGARTGHKDQEAYERGQRAGGRIHLGKNLPAGRKLLGQ